VTAKVSTKEDAVAAMSDAVVRFKKDNRHGQMRSKRYQAAAIQSKSRVSTNNARGVCRVILRQGRTTVYFTLGPLAGDDYRS
jgi:hypothetical protein